MSEQPNYSFSATGVALTLVFSGPFTDCLAGRPAIGATYNAFSTDGLRVTQVDLEGAGGPVGKLTLRLVAPIGENIAISAEPIGAPIYELEYGTTSLPLERHPRAPYLITPPEDTQGASWLAYPDIDGDYVVTRPGGFGFLEYQFLRGQGIDSFDLSYPIITRTLLYFRKPEGLGDGVNQFVNPPIDAPEPAPPDWGGNWIWRMDNDRLSAQGRQYNRVTQFRGLLFADAVASNLLYTL